MGDRSYRNTRHGRPSLHTTFPDAAAPLRDGTVVPRPALPWAARRDGSAQRERREAGVLALQAGWPELPGGLPPGERERGPVPTPELLSDSTCRCLESVASPTAISRGRSLHQLEKRGCWLAVTWAKARKTGDDRDWCRPGAESGRGWRPALEHRRPGAQAAGLPQGGCKGRAPGHLVDSQGQRAADERGGLRRERAATRDTSRGQGGQGAESPTQRGSREQQVAGAAEGGKHGPQSWLPRLPGGSPLGLLTFCPSGHRQATATVPTHPRGLLCLPGHDRQRPLSHLGLTAHSPKSQPGPS